MKKPRKNPHAVALGRLGGLVRSQAKKRANRENGRKGGRSKAARNESRPGATPDAHDRDAERKDSSCSWGDSLAFRRRRDWSGGWRNPLFGSRAPLHSVCAMSPIERSGPVVQLSFLCPCGSRIALKTLGCCRSCYDRRHLPGCLDCGRWYR